MRIRERGPITVLRPVHCGYGYYDSTYPYGDGPWVLTSNYRYGYPYTGTYTMALSKCRDELHPGPPYKSGGPFDKWDFYTDEKAVKCKVDVIKPGLRYRYNGGFLPISPPSAKLDWSTFTSFINSDAGNPYAYGATGWNKFRPTKPSVNLGQTLGEIKEVPRMLKTSAKGFHDMWRSMGGSKSAFAPKRVANHWLNHQFGWLPFLGELRGLYQTTKTLDRRIKRLRRYNGQWEKRGGVVHTESDSEVPTEGYNTVGLWPAPTGVTGATGGWYKFTTSFNRRVWFVGRFRYFIPGKPGSWQWKARAVALIYGLQPSPSLVWELTPWSWLIDWWSNTGDIIENLSDIAINNLVAKYAYVMGTTSYRCDYDGHQYLYGHHSQTGHWFAEYVRKSRVHASPFGFGLTGSDFSLRQWSILAALGITRLKF